MAFGENYGDSTLAKSLMVLSKNVYYSMDEGAPREDLLENAKWLMEGSMVLWERLVEQAHEE